MKWIAFKSAAYPPAFSVTEKDNSVLFHMNRWVGLRFAYLFYHLGFSANFLSIIRVALAALGLYLVFYHWLDNNYDPVIGIFLLAWQVNLDFADGAIARVSNKSSALGEKLDGLANDFARGALLILISISTGWNYVFIIGMAASFILVKFFAETFALVEKFYGWSQYPFSIKLLRNLLSVPVMVVALPTIIAILNILDYQITLVALLITTIYTLLAISWLIVVSIASRK
jgi:phosphatidylglycerophosphate synthase